MHDVVAQKSYDPELPPLPEGIEDDEDSVKIIRLVKNKEPLVSSFFFFFFTGISFFSSFFFLTSFELTKCIGSCITLLQKFPHNLPPLCVCS